MIRRQSRRLLDEPRELLARTGEERQEERRFVALGALTRALQEISWAPLRVTTRGRQPVSPRLPHALVLHLAYELRGGVASDRGAAGVVPDPARLGALTAATADAVGAALDALLEGGVLSTAEPGGRHISVVPHLYGPPPRVGELTWGAIADATVGSPSAWVLAHYLADLPDRDGWTSVSRRTLEEALGSGTSGLRAALDRLVGAAVLARREQRGGVSAFQFTDSMKRPPGAGARPADIMPSRPIPNPDGEGVVLQVGGVDLDVPPGMRVVITKGADGRPRIALLPG